MPPKTLTIAPQKAPIALITAPTVAAVAPRLRISIAMAAYETAI